MVTTDQGLAILFIRAQSKITPASPKPNAVDGGEPATSHGWYGWPITANDLQKKPDFGDINTVSKTFQLTKTNVYLMQAYESGGGCVSPTRRVWVSVGTSPDIVGAYYSGDRCSPPGAFSNFAVLAIWG